LFAPYQLSGNQSDAAVCIFAKVHLSREMGFIESPTKYCVPEEPRQVLGLVAGAGYL
jgi:hypothetical protein